MTPSAIRSRRGRLVARLLAVCGLLLTSGVVALAAAEESTAAACPSSSGVTVVVDYGSLGGTSVGCATNPRSGLGALDATGHSVTYVPRQPGLVCAIDRRPDPCNGAPTTAYWSYWRASLGGSWSYSTVGAASTHPASGTAEGWAFGAGKPPSLRPPSRPRPTTSTSSRPASRTSTHPATGTGKAGTSGGASTRAGSTGAASADASGTARSTTSPAPSSVGASRRSTAVTTAPGSAATTSVESTIDVLTATRTDAAGPTSATSSSGGTGTVVVAAVLVLLLAAGAGLIAWRRRRDV